MSRPRLVGLLAVLCSGHACFAQTGSVAGYVQDARTGEPLPGAHVVIVGAGHGAVADVSGRFRLERVAVGPQRVRASFVGYAAGEQVIEVMPGQTVEVGFELEPEAVSDPIEVMAERLRSVGRTRSAPHLIPQGVAVLDEDQLRAQGPTDVESALRNVSSVTLVAREQPFATFALRGFEADGTGSFRRNGIEIPHLFDGLRANVTQVEVLKGPASVLYGRLEPGGVVNFVTRQPRCGDPTSEIEATAGPFMSAAGRATIAPPCAEPLPAVVLDASAERRESFRDQLSQESAFVAGAARRAIAPRTQLGFDAEYELAGAALDPGVALPGTGVPEGFERSPFFGESDARYSWRSAFASATVAHWSGGDLLRSLTGRLAYGAYRHGRDLVKLDSLTSTGMVARSLTADDTRYRYLFGEVSIDGRFGAAGLEHEYVIGLEGTRLAIDVSGAAPLRAVEGGFRFASIDPIDLANPQPTGLPSEDALVEYASASGSGLNLGLFAQNRATAVTPVGDVHGVLSVRLARVTAGAEWFALAATEDTPEGFNERHVTLNAITPAFALLYAPGAGVSVYASYGTSFNPIFQQVDADGQPFEPTRGEQLEAGVKYERGGLSAALAAFQIDKRGALSRAPDGFLVQTGAQRSRGIEMDLAGSPLERLTILGAYALLDAVVTADEVIPAGNRLPAVPVHSVRAWARYEVLRGPARRLDLSLGVQHVGERFAGLANELRLPTYRLIDAGVTFRPGGRVELQLTGENLLDERYLVSAHRRGGESAGALVVGWPGAPRSVRLRVRAEL